MDRFLNTQHIDDIRTFASPGNVDPICGVDADTFSCSPTLATLLPNPLPISKETPPSGSATLTQPVVPVQEDRCGDMPPRHWPQRRPQPRRPPGQSRVLFPIESCRKRSCQAGSRGAARELRAQGTFHHIGLWSLQRLDHKYAHGARSSLMRHHVLCKGWSAPLLQLPYSPSLRETPGGNWRYRRRLTTTPSKIRRRIESPVATLADTGGARFAAPAMRVGWAQVDTVSQSTRRNLRHRVCLCNGSPDCVPIMCRAVAVQHQG